MKERQNKGFFFRIRGILLLLAAVLCVMTAKETSAAVEVRKAAWGNLGNVMKAPAYEGTWVKTTKGTRFQEENGVRIRSRWGKIDGEIYYLDKNSCRVTGWINYRNHLYYMNRKGRLVTGWVGSRYMQKKNGTYATGFRTIDGNTYFFHPSTGKKVTGWKTINGKTYYFNGKGVMKKDCWVKRNGKKYRLGSDGTVLTNQWITVNGNQYYLSETGTRLFGNHEVDGKMCHFNKYAIYEPDYVFWDKVDPSKPMVALTFDDGPGPYTNRLLDCLEKNHARATFFMVGSSVGSYPGAVSRMVTLHCELGNHSWSHPAMTTLSNDSISSQFGNTSAKIRSVVGKYPTVARLPYGDGHNSSRVLSCIGLPSIYWSIDTMDWANTGNPQHTINEVLNHVQSGDIVLMHDIHSSTVTACETIIPALVSRGYQLVTVSELAQYKGGTQLSVGRTYYSFR